MSDRSVSYTLRATASQYIAEVKKAAQATSELATAADKAEAAAAKVGTEGGKAARQQQQAAQQAKSSWDQTAGAMSQVGATMSALGASALAMTAAVAKTGIEYNTLQQTSRAALKTITGSAEAANAQMDKLDAFAKGSPFSKSVFIQAQQQMLAFGIETQKVIPYLDAINDAVAATGGSSQQVGELAAIMSKVQSSAKITAEDLNQFGERGVDAAKLIGEQMGVTAGEIREQITSGTLDAGQALDALAAGMKENFDGAAANVKETMTGALDRVKAAWRDLSAAMMEPFVSAQGGGFLVDATNQLANFMRAVEALPGPVRASMGGLTALFGVAATGAAAFLLLVPRIVETRAAIETLRAASPAAAAGIDKLGGALGKAAKAASIAVAGFGIVVTAMRAIEDNVPEYSEANQSAEQLATTMQLMVNSAASLDDVFASNNRALFEAKEGGYSAAEAIGRLAEVHDSAGFAVDRFMAGLTGVNTMMVENEQRLTAYGDRLAELPLDQAQMLFAELKRTADEQGMSLEVLMGYTEGYADSVKVMAAEAGVAELSMQELSALMSGEMVHGLQLSADGTRLLSEEQVKAEGSATGMADAQAASADAAREQSEALQEAIDIISAYYDAVLAASNSAIALEQSFDDATEAAAKNGATLDINTEAGRNNQKALNDVAGAASRVAQDMAAAGESTEAIASQTARARDQFIAAAKQMGLTGQEASDLADKYGLIPDEVATRVQQPGMKESQDNALTLKRYLDNLPKGISTQIKTVADLSGYNAVDTALNRINGRTVTAYAAIKQYGQGAVATGGYGHDVATAAGLAEGGMPPHTRHYSGLLYGPGTSTSDSIPAWLSRDEFVVKAQATSYYGPDAMYALNAMALDREWLRAAIGLAGGGMAERPAHQVQQPSVIVRTPAPVTADERAGGGPLIGTVHAYGGDSREVTEKVATHVHAVMAEAGRVRS